MRLPEDYDVVVAWSNLYMSKAEILTELPKLKFKERREIFQRLGEMDGFGVDDSDDLSPEEIAIIEARLAKFKRNPKAVLSPKEMDEHLARLQRRLTR